MAVAGLAAAGGETLWNGDASLVVGRARSGLALQPLVKGCQMELGTCCIDFRCRLSVPLIDRSLLLDLSVQFTYDSWLWIPLEAQT